MTIRRRRNRDGSKSTPAEFARKTCRSLPISSGPWLALHLIRTLQLDTFPQQAMPELHLMASDGRRIEQIKRAVGVARPVAGNDLELDILETQQHIAATVAFAF